MKKIVLLLAIFALNAFAQASFFAILDRYLNEPVEIEFEQRTFWYVRERESRNRGKIILGTNDRFNITSGRMQFVSDGQTFWEFNNRQRQVIIRQISPHLPQSFPTQILRQLRNANLTPNPENNSLVWQDEESKENGFQRVEVFYGSGLITRIVLNDNDNNIITNTFSRTQFLTAIADSVFVFEIPRGAQVHGD